MARNNAPCRDCGKRYLGCHGDCKHYAAFSAAIAAAREERLHDADLEYAAREAARKRSKRQGHKYGGEG